MSTTKRWGARREAAVFAVALLAGAAALPAWALYKVVGPDGKVTYTDRAPTESQGKAVPLTASGRSTLSADNLPFALRGPATKYPVTLYTVSDCEPCNRGRDLLRSRGIPHVERTATTEADHDAWQKQLGSRQAPQLTIGSQRVEGLDVDAWHSYLDAAGYPKQSALPAGYSFAPAQALAPKPAAAAPVATPSPQVVPTVNTDPPPRNSFRF